jgi:hypothetical protein
MIIIAVVWDLTVSYLAKYLLLSGACLLNEWILGDQVQIHWPKENQKYVKSFGYWSPGDLSPVITSDAIH